jgi:hypothetical protein
VLTGHTLADLVRTAFIILIVWIVGLLVGFRPEGTLLNWISAPGLLLLGSLAFPWFSTLLGLLLSSVEAVQQSLAPLLLSLQKRLIRGQRINLEGLLQQVQKCVAGLEQIRLAEVEDFAAAGVQVHALNFGGALEEVQVVDDAGVVETALADSSASCIGGQLQGSHVEILDGCGVCDGFVERANVIGGRRIGARNV